MAKPSTPITFPIDLVYLWVDGNDPKWRAKRNRYMDVGGDFAQQGLVEGRWAENDELRYSLRSIELYAPWINHIFIVTDGQTPSWLDTSNPRISIVDHSDILPAEALPVFSSNAIASCIYKIPGPSEHAIPGNDHTLLNAPTQPETFFRTDGTPIVRVKHNRFNRRKAHERGNYPQMLKRMQDMVVEQSGKKIFHAPHHNFDAYRRSDFEYCVALMQPAWNATSFHRFRHDDDMHRSFVSYYTIATKRAEMRKVRRHNRTKGIIAYIKSIINNSYSADSRCFSIIHPDYDAILCKYNPLMFCINDNERATDNDRQRVKEFLRRKFPNKSSFEK